MDNNQNQSQPSGDDKGHYKEGNLSFEGSLKHTATYAFREQYFRWMAVILVIILTIIFSWWPGLGILIIIYRVKGKVV